MVQFFNDSRGSQGGPCSRIAEQDGDYVRQMIDMTESEGREYISYFVEMDNRIDHTEMSQGKEGAILAKTAARSMMDALQLAGRMSEGDRTVNAEAYNRHRVHTHPNGHTGLSLTDMKNFASDLTSETTAPHSELVATQTEEGIALGGIYRQQELDSEQEGKINSVLTLLNSGKAPMATSQAKLQMLDAFDRADLKFCATVFPSG